MEHVDKLLQNKCPVKNLGTRGCEQDADLPIVKRSSTEPSPLSSVPLHVASDQALQEPAPTRSGKLIVSGMLVIFASLTQNCGSGTQRHKQKERRVSSICTGTPQTPCTPRSNVCGSTDTGTCHMARVGEHTLKSGSTLQSLTALSVGEVECCAVVKGSFVALMLRSWANASTRSNRWIVTYLSQEVLQNVLVMPSKANLRQPRKRGCTLQVAPSLTVRDQRPMCWIFFVQRFAGVRMSYSFLC